MLLNSGEGYSDPDLIRLNHATKWAAKLVQEELAKQRSAATEKRIAALEVKAEKKRIQLFQFRNPRMFRGDRFLLLSSRAESSFESSDSNPDSRSHSLRRDDRLRGRRSTQSDSRNGPATAAAATQAQAMQAAQG